MTDNLDHIHPRAKFMNATIEVRRERQQNARPQIEWAVQRWGYADLNDYWDDALSEEMSVGDFVLLLYSHLVDPQRFNSDMGRGKVLSLEGEIARELRDAYLNREAWLLGPVEGVALNEVRLRPAEAARWLLDRRRKQGYVPTSLRDHLSPFSANVPPANDPGEGTEAQRRRPGPSPDKLNRVMNEMRAMGREAVVRMKVEEMVAHFKAGRTTCVSARDKVFPGRS